MTFGPVESSRRHVLGTGVREEIRPEDKERSVASLAGAASGSDTAEPEGALVGEGDAGQGGEGPVDVVPLGSDDVKLDSAPEPMAGEVASGGERPGEETAHQNGEAEQVQGEDVDEGETSMEIEQDLPAGGDDSGELDNGGVLSDGLVDHAGKRVKVSSSSDSNGYDRQPSAVHAGQAVLPSTWRRSCVSKN